MKINYLVQSLLLKYLNYYLKGFEIDKKNISINNKINSVGEYDISLKIHKDVTHDIKVTISGSVKPNKGKSLKDFG